MTKTEYAKHSEEIDIYKYIYREHIKFVRVINDSHIFISKSKEQLKETLHRYQSSAHKKDRRYYVPYTGRDKFARRKDHEVGKIFDQYLNKELLEIILINNISKMEGFFSKILSVVLKSRPKTATLTEAKILPSEPLKTGDNVPTV